MIAMFKNVKDFSVFNSATHLFSYGEPYQMFVYGEDFEVFVELDKGCRKLFKSRVEQFDGILLGD